MRDDNFSYNIYDDALTAKLYLNTLRTIVEDCISWQLEFESEKKLH